MRTINRYADSSQEIEDLLRARRVLLYVVSSEEERVTRSIRIIGERRRRKVITWSCTEGFNPLDDSELHQDLKDPLKALEYIYNYENDAIFLLKDFHPYLEGRASVPIRRRLRDLNRELRNNLYYRRAIVLLSAVRSIPAEMEFEFAVVDYALPGRKEIENIVDQYSHPLLTINSALKLRVVEFGLGLTEEQVHRLLSMTVVRTGELILTAIDAEKKKILPQNGILNCYAPQQPTEGLAGMEALESWLRKCSKAFRPEAREFGLPIPKGILVLGVPDGDKLPMAKMVGYRWKMPLLHLDVGKAMGSPVGCAVENMRRAIKTVEATAPCILWLDGLEKNFSSVMTDGRHDYRTTQSVFASFITWLQEKPSHVFVIATAKTDKHVPPWLLGKSLFDKVFLRVDRGVAGRGDPAGGVSPAGTSFVSGLGWLYKPIEIRVLPD